MRNPGRFALRAAAGWHATSMNGAVPPGRRVTVGVELRCRAGAVGNSAKGTGWVVGRRGAPGGARDAGRASLPRLVEPDRTRRACGGVGRVRERPRHARLARCASDLPGLCRYLSIYLSIYMYIYTYTYR